MQACPGVQRAAVEQEAFQQFVGHLDVVEEDARRLAAAFEQDPLHGAARGGHDVAADRRAAGEADHVDTGIGGQQLAGLDPARRDDVDDAGRNVGVRVDDPRKRETGERRER